MPAQRATRDSNSLSGSLRAGVILLLLTAMAAPAGEPPTLVRLLVRGGRSVTTEAGVLLADESGDLRILDLRTGQERTFKKSQISLRNEPGDRLDAMLGAATGRKPGDEFGGELHGVEMPPAALVGMVGQSAGASALGAGGAGSGVGQADLDPALIELEINGLDLPGLVNSQQPGIMGVQRFHAGTLRDRPQAAVACHRIPRRAHFRTRKAATCDLPLRGLVEMRIYNPNPKHEMPWLRGPKENRLDLTVFEATQLLNDHVHCLEVPGKSQLVAVKDGAIYVFQSDNTGGYHAYRIAGNEVYAKFPEVAMHVAALLNVGVKKLSRMHE